MPEKTISFTIDEEFHKQIKMRTVETGQFLKGYIINLIEEDLKRSKECEKKQEFSIQDALDKEKELREILNQIAENK